ncbi:MAG: hypothetical protein JXP73_04090 [Deltaproteobacteria bacterium]|nr:hypothetical protein [Deltaproteobacteria bacterium]
MKRTNGDTKSSVGRRDRLLGVAIGIAAISFALGARAEPARGDGPGAAIGGGAVVRILPPIEKIKVLEAELVRETERRVKAEEDNARRIAENNELASSAKAMAKERAALEASLAETRERETQLQKMNDRMRAENERIAVTVRLALPVVAAVAVAILGMLIYMFLFLRRIAARVHSQRTLAEMHELEARLSHANDQYNAEIKRNQTLRHKLADLGITD